MNRIPILLTMKPFLALTFLLVLTYGVAQAQIPSGTLPSEEEISKLEAIRIGLVTTNLNMSPDQAKEFWPAYNEYSAKRKTFRVNMRAFLQKAESMKADEKVDEEENKELIRKFVAQRLAAANLENEYSEKFMKILRPSQVVKLYVTEKEIMRTLLTKIGKQERRKGRSGHHRSKTN